MPEHNASGAAVYHEHPIKILRYSAKNIWLLIFPLLRSLRFYPFSIQNVIEWGAGVWFDLLMALMILGLGALRWYFCSYQFNEVFIRAKIGVLAVQETEIPLNRITATIEEHPFYLRPLRAARLQISTASGTAQEENMKLILRLRDLHRMRQSIPVLQNDSNLSTAHHTPTWRVLLFSALFSSSFSGALYIAALFVQGGRITADLAEEFRAQQLLEDATDRAASVFQGVPRVAITLGIVILSLWLVSFFRNLLRYGRFRIRFGGEHVSVHMGILTRRRFHLRDASIVFPELRQNLVMKICGMVSLHIRCPGYSSHRGTLPVLIPLVRKRNSQQLLSSLHANLKLGGVRLRAVSHPRFFWSFLWPPIISLCALPLAHFLAMQLFPQFETIIRFFILMLAVPLVWFLLVRIVALFSEYVAMDDESVQFHFSRGFIFHTITVRQERVVRADILQTPFQKQYGYCHLYLTCNGPRQQRFKLTALPEEAAREIISALTKAREK